MSENIFDHNPLQEWNGFVARFGMPDPEGNEKITEVIMTAINATDATQRCIELSKQKKFKQANSTEVLLNVQKFFRGEIDLGEGEIIYDGPKTDIWTFIGMIGIQFPSSTLETLMQRWSTLPGYSIKSIDPDDYMDTPVAYEVTLHPFFDSIIVANDESVVNGFTMVSDIESATLTAGFDESGNVDGIALTWNNFNPIGNYILYRSNYQTAFSVFNIEELTPIQEQLTPVNGHLSTTFFDTDNADLGTKYYWVAKALDPSMPQQLNAVYPITRTHPGISAVFLADEQVTVINSLGASTTQDNTIDVTWYPVQTENPGDSACYFCYINGNTNNIDEDATTNLDCTHIVDIWRNCVNYWWDTISGGVDYSNSSSCESYGTCEERTRDVWRYWGVWQYGNWSSWYAINQNETQASCLGGDHTDEYAFADPECSGGGWGTEASCLAAGTCSDSQYNNSQSQCLNNGICSDGSSSNQTSCVNSGFCVDGEGNNQSQCEDDDGTWTSYTWTWNSWSSANYTWDVGGWFLSYPDDLDRRWFGNNWNLTGSTWILNTQYTRKRKCRTNDGVWTSSSGWQTPEHYKVYRADPESGYSEYRFILSQGHSGSSSTTQTFVDNTAVDQNVDYRYKVTQVISDVEGDFSNYVIGRQNYNNSSSKWWTDRWSFPLW